MALNFTFSIFIVSSIFSICFGIEVLELSPKTVDLITIAWNLVDEIKSSDRPFEEKERTLLNKIDEINISFGESTRIKEIDLAFTKIITIFKKMSHETNTLQHFSKIDQYQTFIDTYYKKMEKFVIDFEQDPDKLIKIATEIVSEKSNSVVKLMTKIYRYTNSNLFNKTLDNFRSTNGDIFCSSELAPQQIFLIFLQKILHTHAKSYLTIQFAYIIKHFYNEENFSLKAVNATEEFKIRTTKIIVRIKHHMTSLSTHFWRCDPKKHVLDETYIQVTNLMRGFVVNERDLDPNKNCFSECKNYSHNKRKNNEMKQIDIGNKLFYLCTNILECTELNFYAGKYCTKHPDKRLYSYIEGDNGKIFGHKTDCKQESSLKAYTKYLFKCSYCLCLCDEGPKFNSDRFISLRASLANTADNKVVTGLRFVKRNRIIHLQVQEGKLLSHGQVDRDTVQWVPLEDFKITDRNVYEGQDYHLLTPDERAVDLLTITGKSGSLVTGLRFKRVSKRLILQVLTTPFNYTTGELQYGGSIYQDLFEKFKYKIHKELKLKNPDIPIRSNHSTPITSGQYIKFTHTDVEKDVAQTTVPYFDAQPVTLYVPAPLSGLGLIYKGQKGFGGFIAPKIVVYNYKPHLQIKKQYN